MSIKLKADKLYGCLSSLKRKTFILLIAICNGVLVNAEDVLVVDSIGTIPFTSESLGWSQNTPMYCSNDKITDFSSSVEQYGLYGIGPGTQVQSRTWIGLPPHWSLSVRFDIVLQGAFSSIDYAEIILDSETPEQLFKPISSLMEICVSFQYDYVELFYRNITHTASSVTLTINAMVLLGIDQGVLIRNVLIHVDSCTQACQTCTGPTESQCTSCVANSSIIGSRCVCNSGYYLSNYICVTSCPSGYVAWVSTNKCEIDVCASGCSTCDVANNKCLTCKSGQYNSYGTCLNSCFSYQIVVGSDCIDYASTLINGKFLLKTLFSNTFGESEIVGSGLQVVNFYGKGLSILSSRALTTRCNSVMYLGGFLLSGQNSKVVRSFSGLAPHSSIRINMAVARIDSWDYGEWPFIYIDGVSHTYTNTLPFPSFQYCGSYHPDEFPIIDLNVTHTATTLEFRFEANLDQLLLDESFGIRELFILVDYCTDGCVACNSINCTSCASGLVLNPDQSCQTTCPPSYYKNNLTQICEICHSTCLNCSNGTSSGCLRCSSGLTFISGAQSLPETSPQSCFPCHTSCSECSGMSPNNCVSCVGSLYFDPKTTSCNSSCSSSSFKNPMSNTCTSCDSSCRTCTGKSKNNCSSCYLPRIFQSNDNSCVSACNSNQYIQSVTITESTCLDCHTTCKSCSGPSNNACTSCSGSLFLDKSISTCVSTSKIGYYMNNDKNILSQCNPNCFTCNGPYSTNCLSCTGSLLFNPIHRSCKPTCPNGYYANTTTNECLICDSACLTCSGIGPNQCLSCQTPLIYQSSTMNCVVTCNSNQYVDPKDSSPLCRDCHASCTSCTDELACNKCARPQLLEYLTSNCVDNCATNAFQDVILRQCFPCNSNCQSCFGLNDDQCISCYPGLFLAPFSTQCVSSCPTGYYGDNQTKKCLKCNDTCSSCKGATQFDCITCSEGKVYFENQCLDICPSLYFIDSASGSNQCSQCYTSCKEGCFGPLEEDCFVLKELYLISLYIMLTTVCIWVGMMIYGYYSDRQSSTGIIQFKRNILSIKQEDQNLKEYPKRQAIQKRETKTIERTYTPKTKCNQFNNNISSNIIQECGKKKEENTYSSPFNLNFMDRKPDYLKYSFYGNEWVIIVKHFEANISRVLRVTSIFIKYLVFSCICTQLTEENEFATVTMSLLVGFLSKVLMNVVMKQNGVQGLFSSIIVIIVISLTCLTTGLQINQILTLNKINDRIFASTYSLTLVFDFVVIQQIIGFIGYLSTVKYLRNPDSCIFKNLKSDYFLNLIQSE